MATCWCVSCQLYGKTGDRECEMEGHTDDSPRGQCGSEAGCYA